MTLPARQLQPSGTPKSVLKTRWGQIVRRYWSALDGEQPVTIPPTRLMGGSIDNHVMKFVCDLLRNPRKNPGSHGEPPYLAIRERVRRLVGRTQLGSDVNPTVVLTTEFLVLVEKTLQFSLLLRG